MKKLLAFVFVILSLISANLFAVRIHDVVDNGNGEYMVQRTSRGVDHTFRRAVDGTWTELIGDVLAAKQVTPSFAQTLNASLEAYILGRNACQQTLMPQPAGQQSAQAPQPQVAKDGEVDGEDDGTDMDLPPVDDDPAPAADLAAETEHKRPREGDEGKDGEIPAKRSESIDYAVIGRLGIELDALHDRQVQQLAPATQQQIIQQVPQQQQAPAQQAEGQQVGQQILTLEEFNRAIAVLQPKEKKDDKKSEHAKDCLIQ